jgi:hypothetical protein
MGERGQARLGELLQRQGYAVVDGGLATQLERLGADLNGPAYPPPNSNCRTRHDTQPHDRTRLTLLHALQTRCGRLGCCSTAAARP